MAPAVMCVSIESAPVPAPVLVVGAAVTWSRSLPAVPTGTVGEITEVMSYGTMLCRFPARSMLEVPSTFRKKTRGDLSGSQNTDSFTNGIVILSLHALKSCRRTDNFRSLEIVGGVRGGRALYSRVERRFRGHSL
jgi:hypothetical protein